MRPKSGHKHQRQCTNHCTILSREVKYTGRRSFEATEPTRVGTEPKPVPLLRHSLGTSHYRSFRNDQHNQMHRLQQSVSRPRLLWGGRPSPVRLGSRNKLCQRPVEDSRQCSNRILHQEATIIAPAWKAKNWFQQLKKVCQSNQTTTRLDVLCSKGPSTPGGAKKKNPKGYGLLGESLDEGIRYRAMATGMH